jgi:hypothetical protein
MNGTRVCRQRVEVQSLFRVGKLSFVFIEVGLLGILKNPQFYADFKSANSPQRHNAPIKLFKTYF